MFEIKLSHWIIQFTSYSSQDETSCGAKRNNDSTSKKRKEKKRIKMPYLLYHKNQTFYKKNEYVFK